MNFVRDEGVDRSIVERLRRDGHDVAYIAEMSPSITDDEVLREATERGAVLITIDKGFRRARVPPRNAEHRDPSCSCA